MFAKTNKALGFLLLFGAFVTSLASAQETIRWSFQNPQEVVSASNFSAYQVKDGLFTGKTKWDPIISLALPQEEVDAGKYTFLTVHLFSSAPADALSVYYRSSNGDWCLGGAFLVTAGWATYTIDLNKVNWEKGDAAGPEAKVWGGRNKKISALRIDPGNQADREIKIDRVELSGPAGKEHKTEIDPPSLSPEGKTALESLQWTFTKENDFLGWKPDGFKKIEVKDKAIKGVTNKFSFLFSPKLNLNAGEYRSFVFKAKSNVSGNGNIYFTHANEKFADDKCVSFFNIAGDNYFHVYKVDLGQNKNWQGVITQIRFDIFYVPDAEIEISALSFLPGADGTKKIGGVINNGGFEMVVLEEANRAEGWKTTLTNAAKCRLERITGKGNVAVLFAGEPKSSAALSQEVNFDKLGFYKVDLTYKTDKFSTGDRLNLIFYLNDIFGKPLPDTIEFTVCADKSSGWSNFSETFFLPKQAASGRIELRLVSPSGKSTAYLDNATLSPAKERNIEANHTLAVTKPFSWEGEWIWKTDLDQADKAPVCFRKDFLIADVQETEKAQVIVTADNSYTLYVNGKILPHGPFYDDWRAPDIYDIKPYLQTGKNVLGVEGFNNGYLAGVLLEAGIRLKNKEIIYLKTDKTWRWGLPASQEWSSPSFNADSWLPIESYGKPPTPPWGDRILPSYTYLGPSNRLTVKGFSLPAATQTGKDILLDLTLECREMVFAQASLFVEVVKENASTGILLLKKDFTGLKSGDKLSLKEKLTIAKYFLPGKYELRVGISKSVLTLDGNIAGVRKKDNLLIRTIELTDDQNPIVTPRVKFDFVNGTPAIFINGQLHTTMHFMDSATPQFTPDIKANNLHLYWLNVDKIGWNPADETFDFSAVDQACATLLINDPEAYILISFPVDSVYTIGLKSWNDKYPQELVKDFQGNTNLPLYGEEFAKAPSMASKIWLKTADDLVKNLIRHVGKCLYGERVIGYMPCSGVTYEWQYWGSVAETPQFLDYSQPYQQAFREWAGQKYGTLDNLNKTWHKKYSSLEEIIIPSKEERLKKDLFTFLDPQQSQYLIDLNQFHSEVVADAILRLAKTIKEETKGQALCGTYYGYNMHVLSAYRYQFIGHFAAKKILDSPDVDFLMAPASYADRGMGGGSGFMSAHSSFPLHKKYWINQHDIRTVHATDQLGKVATLADSKSVLERQFAHDIISGCATEWYDFGTGWISGDPRLMAVVGKTLQIEEAMLKIKKNPTGGSNSIAVIVDEKSTYYTALASNIHAETVSAQYTALSRTGVGFDSFLLDDLEIIPDYKCYLFLNTFRITDKQMAFINQHLKKDSKVLVFIYAPGFTDEKSLSLDRIQDLIGIKLSMLKEEHPLKVKTVKSDHNITKYLPEATTYGTALPQGPVFQAEEGEVLGLLEGRDKPGLVVKKFTNWTSIYSSAPLLPAGLLRGIAEYAGLRVFNYNPVDVTFVGDGLIAVHTIDGGKRELFFPVKEGRVKEWLNDGEFILKDGRLSLDLKPRSTYLFSY